MNAPPVRNYRHALPYVTDKEGEKLLKDEFGRDQPLFPVAEIRPSWRTINQNITPRESLFIAAFTLACYPLARLTGKPIVTHHTWLMVPTGFLGSYFLVIQNVGARLTGYKRPS